MFVNATEEKLKLFKQNLINPQLKQISEIAPNFITCYSHQKAFVIGDLNTPSYHHSTCGPLKLIFNRIYFL